MVPPMTMLRMHLLVQGKVQGVWFRDSTRRQAETLGLGGWVRNLPDGSVEVLVEGPEEGVRTLVRWCRQGPPRARVMGVLETEEPWREEFSRFEVR